MMPRRSDHLRHLLASPRLPTGIACIVETVQSLANWGCQEGYMAGEDTCTYQIGVKDDFLDYMVSAGD